MLKFSLSTESEETLSRTLLRGVLEPGLKIEVRVEMSS